MGVYVRYQGEEFFVDNFASHAHDHFFTTSAWDLTLKHLEERGIKLGEVVTKIKVWSDGGLKTKENLRFFQKLSEEKGVEIQINFYGPYHGHNVQDAHFGAGKILLRSEAKNGPIASKEQVLEAFGRLKSKKEETRKKKGLELRRTGDFVVLLSPNVEEEEKRKKEKVMRIKGQIRKWFSWKMEGGRCWSKDLSGEGLWKENPIELLKVIEGEEEMEEIDEQEEEDRRTRQQEEAEAELEEMESRVELGEEAKEEEQKEKKQKGGQ